MVLYLHLKRDLLEPSITLSAQSQPLRTSQAGSGPPLHKAGGTARHHPSPPLRLSSAPPPLPPLHKTGTDGRRRATANQAGDSVSNFAGLSEMQVAEDALPPQQPDGDVSTVSSPCSEPRCCSTRLIANFLQVSECRARVCLGGGAEAGEEVEGAVVSIYYPVYLCTGGWVSV